MLTIIFLNNKSKKTISVFVLFFLIVSDIAIAQSDLNSTSSENNNLPLEKSTIIINRNDVQSSRINENTNDNSLILPLPNSNINNETINSAKNLNSSLVLSTDPNILKIQTIKALKNQNYNLAKLYLNQLINVDPNNFQAYIQLANIADKENNPIEALKDFAIANFIQPHNFIVKANIESLSEIVTKNLNSKFRAGYFFGARSEGQKMGLLSTGIIFYSLGYLSQAKDIFMHLLKNDPTCTRAWINLGIIEMVSGNYKLAKLLLEKAKSINPIGFHTTQINRDLINIERLASTQEDVSNNNNNYPLVKIGNKVEPAIFVKEGLTLPVHGAYCQYCLHFSSAYNAGMVD